MRVRESSRKNPEAKEGVRGTAQQWSWAAGTWWYVANKVNDRNHHSHQEGRACRLLYMPIRQSAVEEVCTWHRLVATNTESCLQMYHLTLHGPGCSCFLRSASAPDRVSNSEESKCAGKMEPSHQDTLTADIPVAERSGRAGSLHEFDVPGVLSSGDGCRSTASAKGVGEKNGDDASGVFALRELALRELVQRQQEDLETAALIGQRLLDRVEELSASLEASEPRPHQFFCCICFVYTRLRSTHASRPKGSNGVVGPVEPSLCSSASLQSCSHPQSAS